MKTFLFEYMFVIWDSVHDEQMPKRCKSSEKAASIICLALVDIRYREGILSAMFYFDDK